MKTDAALPLPHTEHKEGPAQNGSAPHLSFSRINRYLTCPEQYRLHYIEGWRLKFPSANLIFGQNIHQALNHHFATQGDPVGVFEHIWGQAKEMKLAFSHRDTWESLAAKGKALLEKFMQEQRSRIGQVWATEKSFELAITSLDLPFIGIIDLVAELDSKKTVVDFKTAAAAYDDHEVELSDQLTAYQLAQPDAVQAALCVLVKTKEPKIEWHLTRRTGPQLVEFLAKAGIIGQDIAAGRFYKRPGKHCAWCDFLPVCLGDRGRVDATLVRNP